jgi:hypothetical protein
VSHTADEDPAAIDVISSFAGVFTTEYDVFPW